VIELRQGEAFHIAAGLRHRFEAKEAVDLLEASTPELDDVVRLEDRYGRAGT
jgi:quercetin dioxygenase-like cupin family protein